MNFKSIIVVLGSATFMGGCGDESLTDSDSASAMRALGSERENFVVAATGLGNQPGVLEVTVPVSTAADIVSAHFRWVGRGSSPTGDPTILINGHQRPGTLLASYEVGGDFPWVFFYEYEARALMRRGLNRFFASGFDLPGSSRPDGIAIVVVYLDADSPWTAIHTVDPREFVSAGPGDVWEFPIGTSADARQGHLVLLAGDCTPTSADRVWWSAGPGPAPGGLVGTAPNVLTDRLVAAQGSWVDVLTEDVTIPAGASHFAYQLDSPADGTGDSIVHFLGVLGIDGQTTTCIASLSGRVWQDDDRDGVEGSGEPGLEGLTVNLHDDPGIVVATTITDETGAFSFDWLCAGDYFVEIDKATLPAGLEPTTCGGGDCSPWPVSLPADDSVLSGLAFGFAEPPVSTTGCFFGPGFWKHEFDVLTGAHGGRQHIDATTLEALLVHVEAAAARDWTGGDDSLDPLDVAATLHRRGSSTCDKLDKHYVACLLNYAFNGARFGMPVDTDGDGEADTAFGDVLDTVSSLVANGGDAGCREAQRLVSAVNAMPSQECPF